MTKEITTSRRLAPEDIIPGIYIAITSKVHEIVPFWLIGCVPGAGLEPIRIPCLECAEGEPRRVLAVCLPFVMAENAQGRAEVLDVRQCTIVQVDEMYALEMFTRPGSGRCPCTDL